MLPPVYTTLSWSGLMNLIISSSLVDSFATCILWHDAFPLDLNSNGDVQFVLIHRKNLRRSFDGDVYDFHSRLLEDKFDNLLDVQDVDENLAVKLAIAIEHTNCESFIAFQEDIPQFAVAFRLASLLSLWRSQRTKFLFIYRKDLQQTQQSYFTNHLFTEQPNILVVESAGDNSPQLLLKTNKFVGSLYDSPEELYELCRYNLLDNDPYAACSPEYPNKIQNHQGRELIMGVLDYRPYVVLDFEKSPQLYDHAESNVNHSLYVDGIEFRLFQHFCEIYNCSIEVDSSEEDWGNIHENGTGYGMLGNIVTGRIHCTAAGIYQWWSSYAYMDMSYILGRSGITAMVPIPPRLSSWKLPMKPFHWTLWCGIIACLSLEAISLTVAMKFEGSLGVRLTSWWQCIQYGSAIALKLFVSQSSSYRAATIAIRLLLFAAYSIDIIVTSVYSGGLSSILTTPIREEAADSLWRLYTHKLLWAGVSVAWIASLVNVEDDIVIETLLKQFRVNTTQEMQEMAKTVDMGFVLERLTFGHFNDADFLTDEALERLKLMVDEIYSELTVAYMSRLWPFLRPFNEFALTIQENGLNKYWEWQVTAEHLNIKRQERMDQSRVLRSNIGPVKLDLKNFSGLIIVWLVGVSSSLVVFCGELLLWQVGKRNQ